MNLVICGAVFEVPMSWIYSVWERSLELACDRLIELRTALRSSNIIDLLSLGTTFEAPMSWIDSIRELSLELTCHGFI